MNTKLEHIEAEALKLPIEDRERLIETLVESLDQADGTTTGDFGGFATAELQKYWLDEVERRMQQIRLGERKTLPADEVMANVRARLKASREVR